MEKGSFQKGHLLEILENLETLEKKGESDHFLEILENSEILEIPPVKDPFRNDPFFRSRFLAPNFSGLQKGPAERSHVKKRQKRSKSAKMFFDIFRLFSRGAKNVKKSSKNVKMFFDTFGAAPLFRALLGGPDVWPPIALNFSGFRALWDLVPPHKPTPIIRPSGP